MIDVYVTEQDQLLKINEIKAGCWINMIAPGEQEILSVSDQCQMDPDLIRAAMDIDERSRIDFDEHYAMVLVNIPAVEKDKEKELYTTIPLSVIVIKDTVITVCSEETPILKDFSNGQIRGFHTQMKSRFILQILFRMSKQFLSYLHVIDKKSEYVEAKLQKSTKNKELIELLRLEKSLVYFTTALRSNESVMKKLFRSEMIRKYPEDSELLEDVIVETEQAIEMANIYSGILSGLMDAYASVISNNLNIVMKVLAVVTVIMSIPTLIFSAYGMNINEGSMPFSQHPNALWIIIALSLLASIAVAFVFSKMKMFK